MTGSDPQIYATLTNATRVWAVGAVHGERQKLASLHDELRVRLQPGDRLVYLGNTIGYGPDVVGTVDEIISFRREFLARPGTFRDDHVLLRGAQEEMLRKLGQLQLAPGPGEALQWMLDHGAAATLESYGINCTDGLGCCREGVVSITRWSSGITRTLRNMAGHDEYYVALRRAALTNGGELLFSAAGVNPDRPVSEQGDAFWWGSARFTDIQEPWRGFVRITRGCDPVGREAQMGAITATLDGGAGTGGTLHAACFTLDGKPIDWIQL
jgi:serine/threonine protein phosphatase 1